MNQGNQNMQNNQQNQQTQQLSQEELQKTQVLNLQDFEETARYEKMTSKKPAIIVALIGVLSIFFGTTFGVVQTLNSSPTKKDTSTIEKRETTPQADTITCTLNQAGLADGTDQAYSVIYTFSDNKLTKFTRTTTIMPTAGNANGPAAITSYKQAFVPYLISLNGYQVILTPSGEGIVATTSVDYSKLDLSTFPEAQQATPYTKVDYAAGTDKTSLQSDMFSQGYTCQ